VLGYGLDDRGSRVRFPAGAGNFSLHHRVQNGSGAHPASYPMGTSVSFSGGKAARAWSWPLTSISCRGQRMSGAIPPLPNTPSWRFAQLKHRDNFTFTLCLQGDIHPCADIPPTFSVYSISNHAALHMHWDSPTSLAKKCPHSWIWRD
jgi:hypothetical protein